MIVPCKYVQIRGVSWSPDKFRLDQCVFMYACVCVCNASLVTRVRMMSHYGQKLIITYITLTNVYSFSQWNFRVANNQARNWRRQHSKTKKNTRCILAGADFTKTLYSFIFISFVFVYTFRRITSLASIFAIYSSVLNTHTKKSYPKFLIQNLIKLLLNLILNEAMTQTNWIPLLLFKLVLLQF